jgi:hypothetical protein
VTVTVTNCHYRLHASGTTDIVSVGGECALVVKAGTCKMTMGAQEGLSSTRYENLAGGMLRIGWNLAGIKVTKNEDAFLCPLNGTGEATGSLTGNIRASGTHEGSPVAITVE